MFLWDREDRIPKKQEQTVRDREQAEMGRGSLRRTVW